MHQLTPVLQAVKTSTQADPCQVLADTGYRSEEEMATLAKDRPDTELVIALGREGREQAKQMDAERYPHTVAMQAKFQTDKGEADFKLACMAFNLRRMGAMRMA